MFSSNTDNAGQWRSHSCWRTRQIHPHPNSANACLLCEQFFDCLLPDVDVNELVNHAEEIHHGVPPDVVDALGHFHAFSQGRLSVNLYALCVMPLAYNHQHLGT